MKGKLFPASKSLLGLGLLSSSSSRWLPSAFAGFLSLLSAMRLSMLASDSGVKGLKLSGPGGASSWAAIFSSCSCFVRQAVSGAGQLCGNGNTGGVNPSLLRKEARPNQLTLNLQSQPLQHSFRHDMVLFLIFKKKKNLRQEWPG